MAWKLVVECLKLDVRLGDKVRHVAEGHWPFGAIPGMGESVIFQDQLGMSNAHIWSKASVQSCRSSHVW